MAFKENSDMQLLEISNRARKLTQMVSSWFKDASLVGGSKYINNGLLTDALQESLNMPVQFLDKREVDRSRRVAIGDYSKRRFQEDERFGSRSWRSCNEELKKVIRESLLLSCLDDEKASSSRSLGSFITSGLNSSYHEEETKRKTSISPSVQAVRMKAPNLIARLMGLEEIPVGASKPVTTRQNCKNLNSAKEKFDGEVPEETTPVSIEPATKPQRVTLRSIIEREKVEDLMERLGHSRDCGDEPNFSDISMNDAKCQRFFVDEQHSPFLGRGVEQGLNECKYCIQGSGRVAEVEHEEITMNHRLKIAHEPESKEGRSLKRTEVEPLEKSRLTSSSSMAKKTDVENAAAPLPQIKKTTAATAEAQRRAASAKSSVSTKGGASHRSSMIYETNLVARSSTTHATEKENTRMKPAKKMTTVKVKS